MGAKRKKKFQDVVIIDRALDWAELSAMLEKYVGMTIEFVMNKHTFSGEIANIKFLGKEFFVVYYKNLFAYKEDHGWVFESEEEQSFEIDFYQVKVVLKGTETIEIKFKKHSFVYLKLKEPRQVPQQKTHKL